MSVVCFAGTREEQGSHCSAPGPWDKTLWDRPKHEECHAQGGTLREGGALTVGPRAQEDLSQSGKPQHHLDRLLG